MKMSKIRRRLEKSLNDKRIATVVRDAFELAMTDGIVVALTDDWVIMHGLDNGVYVDGFVMLRLRDVSRVLFRDDDAYHHRAMAGLGQSVAAFECDDNMSVQELLKAASTPADIIQVHSEVLVGEPMVIGRVVEFRKKSCDLHYVGRDGRWARDLDRLKYRDITHIAMGGRYLDALNKFADPAPRHGCQPLGGHTRRCARPPKCR